MVRNALYTSADMKFLLVSLFSTVAHINYALEPLKYNNPGLVVDLGVGLWAWPLPCDADGDGDYDLIVSCPDKPSNGIYLFENTTGATSKNKMPIFSKARRISATVPYVMPSYVDGKMHVLSPGIEYLDFCKTGIETKQVLPIKGNYFNTQKASLRIRHNQWRYADFNGDGREDLIVAIEDWSDYGWDNAWDASGHWTNGPLRGRIHVFYGRSDKSYSEPYEMLADGKPLETFGCPSPNFVNCDADDDLDLICGSFLDGFTYYENSNTSSEPLYAAGKKIIDPQGREVKMDLQMIVPIAFDWDNDGDADLIVGDEDGRVAFVENTGTLVNDTPVFLQPVYFQQQADTLKCGALATPFAVDWDADGDIDLLSGNSAGYIEYFENLSGRGVEAIKWDAPKRLLVDGKPFRIMAGANGSIQGPAEAKWGYTTINVVDWNHDGLLDILYNSIFGDVMWLKNTGTKQVAKLSAPQAIEVEWSSAQPALAWGWRKPDGKKLMTQWRTTPVAHDINHDGLLDLVMLDQEGYLAFFERNKDLTLQAPKRSFLNIQNQALRLNDQSAGKSGRRKLCLTDWDGDGFLDLLVNSKNADLWRQVAQENGKWKFQNLGAIDPKNIEGHDVSPTTADFDDDGTPDFIGGAEDGRMYFMKHKIMH